MGLKHIAKKGTVIEANGVKVIVLRGAPQLEITAPRDVVITIGRNQTLTKKRMTSNNAPRSKRS